MEPKVSVVIPIYNVEKYLRKCLQSVMDQTLEDIEVICVDDASTDHSYLRAQEYIKNDSRFSLYSMSRNRGLSFVRNYGMEKAKGKYIYFLDSDDYLEIDALEKLYVNAKKYNVQGIYFGAEVEYEEESARKYNIIYKECKKVLSGREFYIGVNQNDEYQNAVCMQFWQREYILKNHFKFYEDVLYEDTLYTLQLLMKAERVICIADVLYHYRKRKTSITGNQGKAQLKSYMIIYYEVLKLWLQIENANELEDGIRKRLDLFHRRISLAIAQLGYIPQLQFEDKRCQYLYERITKISPDYYYTNGINHEISEYLQKFKRIYIYGDGFIADEIIRLLEDNKKKISGIIVTKRKSEQELFSGYKVFELEEIGHCHDSAIILLAVSRYFHEDLKKRITKEGYEWVDLLK